MSADEKYLVVSCDGGGIRGVMTAMMLQDLGPEVLGKVRLYAGTSTGMLLALALAAGKTPGDVIDFYQNYCCLFFEEYKPSTNEQKALGGAKSFLARGDDESLGEEASGILEGLSSILDFLLFPLYSSAGAKEALEKILPDMTLGEVWERQEKRVLVSTYELGDEAKSRSWRPRLFHNLPNLPGTGASDSFTLLDIARAAAAPATSYRSHKMADGVRRMDGGTYVNNPALVAVTSLLASMKEDLALDQICLLSIGTGLNPARYPIEDNCEFLPYTYPWGLLGWMWPKTTSTSDSYPLVSAMYDGVSQINSSECGDILRRERYRRANPDLGGNHISMSDCDETDTLMEIAANYIQGDEWKEIVEWLETEVCA